MAGGHDAQEGIGVQGAWDTMRRRRIEAAARRRKRRRAIIALLLAVLALSLAGAYANYARNTGIPLARPAAGAVQEYNATTVSVPESSVGAAARFFEWNEGGKNIRFFAVRGSDGDVRTAFDNAYCCYRRNLGERQEGASMVCNWCQKAFPIDELGKTNLNATMARQCCPANLPHTAAGGLVLIDKADLLAGAYLFPD